MALRHISLIQDDVYTDDTIPLTLEEDMAEPTFQTWLVNYLISVLRWYFQPNDWFIANNLAIYPPHPRDRYDHIDPDLAVFIGTPHSTHNVKSWKVNNTDHPAPTVVFEVASEGTWRNDVENKPLDYARMGAQEYYAYDPNDPPAWGEGGSRLRGWRRVADGELVELERDAQGHIWSVALESFLVPDDQYLRLTDRSGVRRPSEREAAEANAAAAQANRREVERMRAYIIAAGGNPDAL